MEDLLALDHRAILGSRAARVGCRRCAGGHRRALGNSRPPDLAKPRLSAAELRTLRAFAEAMAPGIHGLPPRRRPRRPARGAVDVAAPLDRYLASLPPRARLADPARAALVRVAAVPWRFSRASLAARQDFLRKLERPRAACRERSAAVAEGAERPRATPTTPASAAAVGSEATCARRAASLAAPAPAHAARRARAARRRRGVRRRDRRLGRRRRGRRGGARRGRARRRSCSRPGPYMDRETLPGGAARGAAGALPRRRPHRSPRAGRRSRRRSAARSAGRR